MKKYYLFIFLALPLVFLSACSSDKNVSTNEEILESNENLSPSQDQVVVQEGESIYEVGIESSVVKWSAQKVLVRTSDHFGTIDTISGNVVLGENNELVGGKILMDMNSIKVLDTDSVNLLKHLKSADFFDVENYSTAEFVLKRAEKLDNSESNYLAVGDMTIKGKTNEVEVEVKLELNDNSLTAETKFEIDRTRWDIVYGSGNFFKELGDNAIDDMIGFDIKIVAEK